MINVILKYLYLSKYISLKSWNFVFTAAGLRTFDNITYGSQYMQIVEEPAVDNHKEFR